MELVTGDSLRAALWKYGPLCPIFFTWLLFTFSCTWGRLRTEPLLLSSNCALLMLSLSTLKRKQGLWQSSTVDYLISCRNGKEVPGILQCCKLDRMFFIITWSLKSVHLQNNRGGLWTVVNAALHILRDSLSVGFWAVMKGTLILECKVFWTLETVFALCSESCRKHMRTLCFHMHLETFHMRKGKEWSVFLWALCRCEWGKNSV